MSPTRARLRGGGFAGFDFFEFRISSWMQGLRLRVQGLGFRITGFGAQKMLVFPVSLGTAMSS